MKGFKPTGFGPSTGFRFPSHMGFTGSTGNFTNVSPYVRRRNFANGGFVQYESDNTKTIGDQGSALVRRARSSTALDQASGGKTPIRPGFKRGGKCMKDGGKWIAGAIKHPGALHKALGVPQGEKIPAKKLAKAAHSDNPTMRRRATLAKTLKKMHKADGGDVRLPRRQKPFTFMESVRAVPGALKEAMRYAMSSAGAKSTGMAKKTAETIGGREKQINDYLDEAETGRTASNYARGGKMKRMGYANGGRRDGVAPGGVTSPPPPPKKPMPKKPMTPAAIIKEKFYARGGGVSASQAKHIAERTIGEHVRYPAPKGHKGLEKVMRR